MSSTARAAVVAVGVALTCAAPASADWLEPFAAPSPINFDAKRTAAPASLADVGGRPTVAWAEDATAPGAGNASVVHVAQLAADGKRWQQLPGEISRVGTASSANPSVTDVDGSPWVAWGENFEGPTAQIRVARYDDAFGWERVVDTDRPINQTVEPGALSHADNPVIVDGGDGRPYVAFWQFVLGGGSVIDPSGMAAPATVRVVRLSADEQRWEQVAAGPANEPATAQGEPGIKDAAMADVAMVGGRLWVTYVQFVAQPGGGLALQVRAARLSADGRDWERFAPLTRQPEFRALDIEDVGGAPMVAVNLSGGRVWVGRPGAGGWDAVGGGFASPGNVNATDGSLAELGGVPWVTYNANGQGAAVRLLGGEWVPTGGPITGPRDRINAPRLREVGGLPWVAFTEDDGTRPPEPGERGCCDQVRAARLAPDFGSATVYAAPTTAAVLAQVETFGLNYPLGLDVTPPAAGTVFTQLSPDRALAELRGLKPATVHSLRPYATAGTPAKVYGAQVQFVTPPAEEAAVEPPVQPAPVQLGSVQARPAALLLGILRAPARVRRARTLRLSVMSTEAGSAELVVKRNRRVVRRSSRTVPAGRWNLTWKPRVAPGRYVLRVTLRTGDGRAASDAVTVRIVRRAP